VRPGDGDPAVAGRCELRRGAERRYAGANMPANTSNIGPVLITGCSSGLGHATACLFRDAGYVTVATARDPARLADLQARGCETVALDVTDGGSRAAAVAEVERRHGAVGILINNAGYGQYGPLEEIPLDEIRLTFETNVIGLIAMSQLVLPGMRKSGRGRVVNISSVAGRISTPGGAVYHMSKFCVEAVADALRPEVAPFGIDVVNVLPGPFASAYRVKLLGTMPDTGRDSPYFVFKRNLGAWMHDFLEPGAFGVLTSEQVARVVFKAGTAPRPRTRYFVGVTARWGPVGRALAPDRLVDFFMRRQIPPN
jgi:NAD(P)-dependent dehydrogenase (short-subunit alcohol dehydrogenase family)